MKVVTLEMEALGFRYALSRSESRLAMMQALLVALNRLHLEIPCDVEIYIDAQVGISSFSSAREIVRFV